MEIGLVITGFLIGGVAVWLISKFKFQGDSKQFQQRSQQLEIEKVRLDQELRKEREKNIELVAKISTLEADYKNLDLKMKDQIKDLEVLQDRFSNQFKVLANNIFEEKSQKFTDQNKNNLTEILDPLKEKIKEFEKKVDQSNKESLQWNSALKQQISSLQQLNLQMSKEAENLAKALKGDSKTRGDWGETRLEMVLEKAGLEKDIHFTMQGGIRDEEGKLRKPDFVVNLPDNKHMIIDSKVSLVYYERYSSSEDGEERNRFLKQHLHAVRENFKDLGSKNYQNLYGINSPDYVLMYFPIEPAFNAAVQADPKIFFDALERNIVLVTTTTLLATMRTVSFIWKQDYQKKYVLEIARESGGLYDKFVGFTNDLLDLGNRLKAVQNSYEFAMNKLSTGTGNLVNRAEKIKKLGAKTTKTIEKKLIERAEE